MWSNSRSCHMSYLHRSPTLKKILIINTYWEVLRIPGTRSVSVEDIRDFVSNCEHPFGKWDGNNISNIATTLVEWHDSLDFQANFHKKLKQASVSSPFILLRPFVLNESPPNIYHDAINSNFFQLLQLLLKCLRIIKNIVNINNSELQSPQKITISQIIVHAIWPWLTKLKM